MSRFALATVVGVRGSTYRGLAARQLVAADGTSVGTVSGGCLDSDLSVVAARVRASGRPELVEFDLTADDEAVWGWGIGCNGVTELLVEPENSSLVLAGSIKSMPPGIVHVLSGPDLGSHIPVTLDDPEWGEEVLEARVDGRHRRVDRGRPTFLVEVISGRPRLVVCGAGHDAVPLVRLASELGFEVSVVDDRQAVPLARAIPRGDDPGSLRPADLATHVPMDPGTAVVIMSHNYLRDLDFLRSLLGRQVAYIGCLGPGERLERMLKDLVAAGTPDRPGGSREDPRSGRDRSRGRRAHRNRLVGALRDPGGAKGSRGGFLVDSKGPSELRRLP